MMEKETAQKLSPLTSSQFWNRGIEAYVASREKAYNDRILTASSFEEVKEYIGRIRELRDMLKISELVDKNKNG